MKLHYYLILVVGLLISNVTFGQGFISRLTQDYPLYLKGEFSQTGARSVHPALPMEAAISDGVLYIEFSSAVGEVNISIANAVETSYVATANVEAAWHLISIPLDNYKPGTYKLEFKNSDGDYVYGEFTIE